MSQNLGFFIEDLKLVLAKVVEDFLSLKSKIFLHNFDEHYLLMRCSCE